MKKSKYFVLSESSRVLDLFHDFWLWLHYRFKVEHFESRVYDHLGMIDTLGHDGDVGRFTNSYSCEMGSYYVLRLPFGWKLMYLDDCGEKHLALTNSDRY